MTCTNISKIFEEIDSQQIFLLKPVIAEAIHNSPSLFAVDALDPYEFTGNDHHVSRIFERKYIFASAKKLVVEKSRNNFFVPLAFHRQQKISDGKYHFRNISPFAPTGNQLLSNVLKTFISASC